MTTQRSFSLDQPIGERAKLSSATRYRGWTGMAAGALSLMLLGALALIATRGV